MPSRKIPVRLLFVGMEAGQLHFADFLQLFSYIAPVKQIQTPCPKVSCFWVLLRGRLRPRYPCSETYPTVSFISVLTEISCDVPGLGSALFRCSLTCVS